MPERSVTTIPATIARFTHAPLAARKKRRTAGYARVSTDSDEQFTSYAAQVDYYTQYIKSREDWEFVSVYTDEGISGTSTAHREGFKAMIADALAGKIDLIVTKSVSRFARNTVDSLTTVRKLKEKGIEIYFEKENIWTLDSKGDVLPSEMIQCNDRYRPARPLGIWAFEDWLPLGGLLFFPESDGGRATGVHTLLTMNTLLTIAWGIVKRVWAIVKGVQNNVRENFTKRLTQRGTILIISISLCGEMKYVTYIIKIFRVFGALGGQPRIPRDSMSTPKQGMTGSKIADLSQIPKPLLPYAMRVLANPPKVPKSQYFGYVIYGLTR